MKKRDMGKLKRMVPRIKTLAKQIDELIEGTELYELLTEEAEVNETPLPDSTTHHMMTLAYAMEWVSENVEPEKEGNDKG